MIKNSSPFDRRLRLLIAREFAARGYYLEAEGFFHRVSLEDLDIEELDLLGNTALAAKNKKQAVSRFERLISLQPANEDAKTGLRTAKELKNGILGHLKRIVSSWNCQVLSRIKSK